MSDETSPRTGHKLLGTNCAQEVPKEHGSASMKFAQHEKRTAAVAHAAAEAAGGVEVDEEAD